MPGSNQLNVMACVYLARADGTIDVLRLLVGWLATIRLTAAMADQLDDALDFWPPRRGPDGAADRDLDGEVRGIARVLRGMMEGVAGTAHPAPLTQHRRSRR